MNNVRINGNNAVINVAGRFDLVKSMEVEQELKIALNQHGCTGITLDLAQTKFIDSSANRLFKKSRDMVGNENFKVINVNAPAVLKAMQTAKLDKIFHIL